MLKSFSWQSFLVFYWLFTPGLVPDGRDMVFAKDFKRFLQNKGSRPAMNEKEEMAEAWHTELTGRNAKRFFKGRTKKFTRPVTGF